MPRLTLCILLAFALPALCIAHAAVLPTVGTGCLHVLASPDLPPSPPREASASESSATRLSAHHPRRLS